MTETLFLVDASSYIFRAYFASPPMRTRAGQATNAIYVFTKMILALISEHKPAHIGIVFDAPGKKFRHTLFAPYKAHRPPPPEDLVVQFPYFRPMMDAMGLACYVQEGYEADDVIASLTHKALSAGYKVCIVSSDKDLMQLIADDKVYMLDTMSKPPRRFTQAEVFARFNVSPAQVVDVLALAGDSSDNIPGAKGIGEKTAGALIAQYGSLEALMADADNIKAKARRENLLAFREQAPISKELVQLVGNLEVELEPGRRIPEMERLSALFDELEFRGLKAQVQSLMGEVPADTQNNTAKPQGTAVKPSPSVVMPHSDKVSPVKEASAESSKVSREIQILCEAEPWLDACAQASHEPWLSVQFHFYAEPYNPQVLGMALCTPKSHVYASLGHSDLLYPRCIPAADFNTGLAQLFSASGDIIVYGFKRISQYLEREHIAYETHRIFDVELAAYLQCSEYAPFDLGKLCQHYLRRFLDFDPGTWLGTGKKAQPLELLGVNKGSQAAVEWAKSGRDLYCVLKHLLQRDGLWPLYADLERPLSVVLGQMEREGIELDLREMNALSAYVRAQMQTLEQEAYQAAGRNFNILSPKQVGELLYQELGLKPKHKKTRQHGLSTDQESLESLGDEHPLPRIILEYRGLSKLYATYTTSLVQMVEPETQRVHGLFHQCVAATGRLSSSEPNLQNIPKRTEVGRKIRACFVARPGHSFVSADYSQIELRIMAHLSQEPELMDAFIKGEDIHQRTAALIFAKPNAEVTKDERRLGKTINFGVLYGMGAAKMARETGYTTAQAKDFIARYHEQFPRLEAFFKDLVEQARERGFVTTILNRRRYTPDIDSTRPQLRAFAERTAVNSPIQGSAADLVKLAMLRVHETLLREALGAQLLIQVHDELIVECPSAVVERCATILRTCMSEVYPLSVPLVVDVEIAKHWV